MKIVIVSDRVYPYFKGGGEKRYWDLAKELLKNGHEIHFFTGQWPKMKKEEIKEGIYLHGVYEVKNFYVNGKKSIKESLIYSYKLFPILLKEDFDLIDCEQMPLFSMFPCKLASVVKNKPLILTWHESWGKYWFEYLGKLKGSLGYLIELIVTHLPSKIISVSEQTTEGLITKLKVSKNKIITIPNAIYFEEFQKIKEGEKSDLIFAGRMLSHKNVDVLIKAVARLNSKIKCIIIGDGPEKERLENLVKELGLDKNIIFKGFIENHDDVLSLIKGSKVFVSPSTREGFGITLIEANACGIPVVTTNHKDNASKNLIGKGNGFVCELDEKEFSKKINECLKNSKNMKQDCLKVAKKYDWKNIIKKFEEVYKK